MKNTFTNDNRVMGKQVAMLTVICLMLCLSFNYTFPLHRDNTTNKTTPLDNHSQDSQPCDHTEQEHSEGIVDRTKKMAMNLEHALRKFIDATPNKAKGKCSHDKHGVIDGDLSNYEQLVIMKKYPFLDLQELDFNLHPLSKNTGQNLNSPQVLSAQDPSFCELSDEVPNVEITNRGLSGFALPMKLAKTENTAEDKINNVYKSSQNAKGSEFSFPSSTKDPPDDLTLIESLEEDIKKFEQHMG